MKTKIIIYCILALISIFPCSLIAQCNGANFEEKNGIAILEMELGNQIPSNWKKENNISGFTGNSYLAWRGNDSFSSPGNGLISYKVKINNPGVYRFQWHNKVGIGSNGTEHNDSWLKFPDAYDFFAQKGSSIKYPRGGKFKKSNSVVNGSSNNGWMKVYNSGGASKFNWTSFTSDNDAHKIYAEFTSAGIYTIQVSARSNGHFINRMVLYKESNYSESNATALNRNQTNCSSENNNDNNPNSDTIDDGSSTDTPTTIKISKIQLINADNNSIIQNIEDGDNINLGSLNNTPIGIVAITNPTNAGSINMKLSGTINSERTEGVTPYSLFGDIGANIEGKIFPSGNYTLKISNPEVSKTLNFKISYNASSDLNESGEDEDDASTPIIDDENTDISFVLLNSETDEQLSTVQNGDIFNKNLAPKFGIIVNTPSNAKQASLTLEGPINRSTTEGSAPFSLFGDIGVDIQGKEFPIGNYSITTTVTLNNGQNISLNRIFTIIEGENQDSTPNNPTDNDNTDISSKFYLVNTATNQDIQEINNGAIIETSSKDNLSIRLETNQLNVKSVIFKLRGKQIYNRTESVKPFALFGDINGNYLNGTLNDGAYSLEANLFSQKSGKGNLLKNKTINFSIRLSGENNVSKAKIYPNPVISSSFDISSDSIIPGKVFYSIVNTAGIQVSKGETVSNSKTIHIASEKLKDAGVYYITLYSKDGTKTIPFVKK
ncbi:T9SS type A sorting domain-containing protein [Croceivirga sp. JEA036]|uniref:T9SS type A sorting domain-containing protein n=1 Tax=Croceivirga sp. JEA036 TaxID=2721162 RepID=UPI00143C5476|nr:T9SS type A sorting domain-containing protein [Croceivirga sp. JEA036]NJB36295.1 T9SS type A sorting domain-containing protein [Croceivirga sp. JEA036]